MTEQMKKWIEKHFKEQWEEIKVDIDFSKETPIETINSLHIIEYKYIIGDDTYRLLFPISDLDSEPLIEILLK